MQAVLRLGVLALGLPSLDDLIRQGSDVGESENVTDTTSDERKAGSDRTKPIRVAVYKGEGGEEDIQEAVEHGDVKTQNHDDCRTEEHAARTDDGRKEDLARGSLFLHP